MTFPLACLTVFTTTLCSAWCWAKYIRYCREHRPVLAGLADCGIYALQMVYVVSITAEHRLAVPVLVAAFIGTYYAVRKR